MLKQRVVTATVLAICFLSVLFYSPWQVFAAFSGAIFCLAFWEWANLAGLSSLLPRVLYAAVSAVFCVFVAWWTDWASNIDLLKPFFLVACCWWALALLWIQGYPSSAIIWGSRFVRMIMGWLVLTPAWIGCLFLRLQDNGAWVVLLVVLIVASADIGAYFGGRAFGKRKLAPTVSPGKSWEGVWFGMLFTAALAIIYNFVMLSENLESLLIVVVPAATISVLGDLLESMVKRHRGVKDSGKLLPGHGGFLDRIDGLVASIPLFSLLVLLTGWAL